MTIRKAKLEDISELISIHERIMDSEKPFTHDEWQNLIENDHTVFVALSANNTITGALVAVDDTCGDLKIDRLFVDTSKRRQHIGAKLVQRFITLQEERGKDAFLRVSQDNTAAITLYKGAGFKMADDVIEKYLTPSALELYKAFGIIQNIATVMTRSADDLTL